MRVLIIDDSAVMTKIVEEALRHAGLGITEFLYAANGLDGLAAIANDASPGQTIDLILCDVHMPIMDGVAFVREKRKRNLMPNVPVVMITADIGDPYLIRAIATGAQGYISKPFTLRQVRTALACFATAQPAEPQSSELFDPDRETIQGVFQPAGTLPAGQKQSLYFTTD